VVVHPILVSIDDEQITRPPTGTASLTFPVTLSVASEQDVTVEYHTRDATATTSIAGYEWSFSDGSGESTTSAQATHTFSQPGTFDVTLQVTDSSGTVSAPVTQTVDVCAPDVDAQSGLEYAWLISCVEHALPSETPRQILSTMRQFYYGKPWSVANKNPNWSAIIPCGLDLPDPTPALSPQLRAALKGAPDSVAEGDVAHISTT
jgi:PKD repeat protein